MASDSQANFDFLNHRITTDPRPEDPGPEWLVWARQLRINHNELLHHMQQISEATARLTEATAHNAEATARHSEAIARIEEQIREQRFSHSELHDKANVIQEDVRRLSDIFDKIETHCDVEINDTWRRISIVEKQQEALLHTVRRCSSRIERSAVDTHNNGKSEIYPSGWHLFDDFARFSSRLSNRCSVSEVVPPEFNSWSPQFSQPILNFSR